MRRRSGSYWTVQYAYNAAGNPMTLDQVKLAISSTYGKQAALVTFSNAGNYASRNEAFRDVVQHPEKFPPGEGKIVFIR